MILLSDFYSKGFRSLMILTKNRQYLVSLIGRSQKSMIGTTHLSYQKIKPLKLGIIVD